jgi:hypothetical protein
VPENTHVEKTKSEREVSFGFSIHVIEKIGPVVNSERAGLLETLELGAFKKGVLLGELTGEKRKAQGNEGSTKQNPKTTYGLTH